MLDTHCHLDLPVFDHDRAAVLERARRVGVRGVVVPGVRSEDFPRVVALGGPGVEFALGIHPRFAVTQPPAALDELAEWVTRNRPVAIGEIGLDHLEPVATHAAQLELFTAQLRLARRHALPVLLHVLRAHDLALSLLRRNPLPAGGIVHAFNGSRQQAEGYLELGFKLGWGGVVTRERAIRIRQMAATVPDSAFVLETDAPFLTPAGAPGERNEPANLPLVARALAGLRGTTPEGIATLATANARQVLRMAG